MRSNRLFAITSVCAVAAFASSALAVPPTNMNLVISQQGGPSWDYAGNQGVGTWSPDSTNPNQWRYAGSWSNASWGANWTLDLDADPFVSNNIAITNNTAVVQTYVVSVLLPVSPVVPFPSTTFGSVSGTVGDTNNDGFAQMTTVAPGSAFYNAYIDGGLYQQLLPDFYSVTTPPVPGATTPFPAGPNFFYFANGQPGVVTSIGITNTFTLTPGDSITFVSTFRVDPIPAPAAGVLLGLGGLVAARRRR